jgi:hypothetical protein
MALKGRRCAGGIRELGAEEHASSRREEVTGGWKKIA